MSGYEQFATAAAGRFRVLHYNIAEGHYTIEECGDGFDFADLETAKTLADTFPLGFVTDDTGRLIHGIHPLQFDVS